MSRLRSIALTAATWLALQTPAWAQEASEPGWRPYVGSYAIVFLLIVLGLMVVCHSRRRSQRSRGASRFED